MFLRLFGRAVQMTKRRTEDSLDALNSFISQASGCVKLRVWSDEMCKVRDELSTLRTSGEQLQQITMMTLGELAQGERLTDVTPVELVSRCLLRRMKNEPVGSRSRKVQKNRKAAVCEEVVDAKDRDNRGRSGCGSGDCSVVCGKSRAKKPQASSGGEPVADVPRPGRRRDQARRTSDTVAVVGRGNGTPIRCGGQPSSGVGDSGLATSKVKKAKR